MKIFWENVVYQVINALLFVYHTLQAYEAQKTMKIRMKKQGRRDRRLDGNKPYLLLEFFIRVRTKACSFFHSQFLGQEGREGCYERNLFRNLFITLKRKLGINYFITRETQETSVSVIMTPSLAFHLQYFSLGDYQDYQ